MNDPASIQALQKLLSKEECFLPPGKYQVNQRFIVDLSATVTKGKGTMVTPTTSLPLIKIMALALHKAGIQKENIKNHIIEAATEALNQLHPVSDYIETTESALDEVQKLLSDLPRVPRQGRTTVEGEISIQELAEVENAATGPQLFAG